MADGLDLGKPVGGMPIGVWIVGGTAVVGGAWFLIRRKKSASSSSNTAATAPTAVYTADTSGGFSQDQAETIYSDIRNLQGQETGFADTASNLDKGIQGVSNQVTGVSNQINKIPAGPPGLPGPAGTPGAPPPPPPPPPPPVYHPTRHIAQVKTDGKHSLNFYASAYGTPTAAILSQTAISESSDYNRPSSALHKYVVKGAWSNVVPAGFTLYVPYIR